MRLTVDWDALQQHHRLASENCYRWVSDESIRQALEAGHFDDLSQPHHSLTHRAARIATIVHLIERGHEPQPISVYIRDGEMHVPDGHHCWRAHEFLRRMHQVPIEIKSAA